MIKMKLFLILLALVITGPIFAANFDIGLEAASNGDWDTALKEWLPLAEKGNADVQVRVGLYYNFGYGGGKINYLAAVNWYQRAVKNGNVAAKFWLGTMLEKGHGIDKDLEKAFDLYTESANKGFNLAQHHLGSLYDTGKIVELDKKKAFSWFMKAAEQGYSSAQNDIGRYYFEGIVVLQDYDTSKKWLTLSAEQGDSIGQFKLGLYYAITKNYTLAHMWLNLAALNGDDESRRWRDNIQKDMSISEVSMAQKLARECLDKTYKDCGN
ncbi:MAG: sel1 repeat family protein [Gammaproteobacteria bacterium]|jgi:uncharacterized protein|nr:sel1 repeat family protein [Gammaproteobacteria bacterium]MBT4451282.1 sel1 repeat family protein [Gammaproteobacteria bacterium]MBT4859173.1 sel1 repeat family protein [Gammaproteobacteria bacterium]